MKNIRSAGFIFYTITKEEPRFLLLHYAAGHWDFPKGKIEKNESTLDAAIRELQEETGLQPISINPNFTYAFEYIFTDYDGTIARKQVLLFLAEGPLQNVTLSHEHQGYEWLSFNDAIHKLTHDNAKDALKCSHNIIKSRTTL